MAVKATEGGAELRCVEVRLKMGSIWFSRTGMLAESGTCNGRGLSGVRVFPRIKKASGGGLGVIEAAGVNALWRHLRGTVGYVLLR